MFNVMEYSYLLVNHTKKCMVIIEEFEELWNLCCQLLQSGWDELDHVEIMHEKNDYHRLKYLANNESYIHNFGDDIFR